MINSKAPSRQYPLKHSMYGHFQSEICYAMPALQALMAFMGGTRSASIAFYRGYIASFPNQQSNHVNRLWLQVDNRV